MKNTIGILLVGLFAFSGCKLGCDAEKVITEKLSGAIASGLQCTNQTQIQADIVSILDETNVCFKPEEKRGPIALIVCPVLANAGVAFLGTQVPASWQCNPSVAQTGVAAVLTQFCQLLPF